MLLKQGPHIPDNLYHFGVALYNTSCNAKSYPTAGMLGELALTVGDFSV